MTAESRKTTLAYYRYAQGVFVVYRFAHSHHTTTLLFFTPLPRSQTTRLFSADARHSRGKHDRKKIYSDEAGMSDQWSTIVSSIFHRSGMT